MKWSKLSKKLKKYVMGGIVQPGEGSYDYATEPSMSLDKPAPAEIPEQIAKPAPSTEPAPSEKFALLRGKLAPKEAPTVDKVQKFVAGGVATGSYQAGGGSSMSLAKPEEEDEKEKVATLEDDTLLKGKSLSSAPTGGAIGATAQDAARKEGKAGTGGFTNIAAYKGATDISGLQKKLEGKAKGIVSDIGQAVQEKADEYQQRLDAPVTEAGKDLTAGEALLARANKGEVLSEPEKAQFREWQQGLDAGGSTYASGLGEFDTSPEIVANKQWGKLQSALGAQTGADLLQSLGNNRSQYYTPGSARLTGGLASQSPEFQKSIQDILREGQAALGADATDEQISALGYDPTKFMSSGQLQQFIDAQKDEIGTASTDLQGLATTLAGNIEGVEGATVTTDARLEAAAKAKERADRLGLGQLTNSELSALGIDPVEFRAGLKYKKKMGAGFYTDEDIAEYIATANRIQQATKGGAFDLAGTNVGATEKEIRSRNMSQDEFNKLKSLYSLANRDAELATYVDESLIGKGIQGPTATLTNYVDPNLQAKVDAIYAKPLAYGYGNTEANAIVMNAALESGVAASGQSYGPWTVGNSSVSAMRSTLGDTVVDGIMSGLEKKYGMPIPEGYKTGGHNLAHVLNFMADRQNKNKEIAAMIRGEKPATSTTEKAVVKKSAAEQYQALENKYRNTRRDKIPGYDRRAMDRLWETMTRNWK